MIQNWKGLADGVYGMSSSTLMLCLLLMVLSSQAQSRCNAPDQRELFELSDIVFAAELTFSHIDFIKRGADLDFYLKKHFYKYKTLHVWKGDPGSEGMAFPAGSDHIASYEYPLLSEYDQAKSEHMRFEAPTIKLMYAHQSEHGLVYGGCIAVSDYQYAFTQRLKLGDPVKSYDDLIYEPPTTSDMFDFIEAMTEMSNEDFYENYHNLEDALNALQMLKQENALHDYLNSDSFMRCDQDALSLNVMSQVIAKLPQYATQLHDKFSFMLSCPQVEARRSVFNGLSQIVTSDLLSHMIEKLMLDPSTILKKAAAESIFELDDDDRQKYLNREDSMLASNDPDERLFAAVMLKRIASFDLNLVISVCQAEPASWQYNENPVYTESVMEQCDGLIRTHQHAMRQAGLLPDRLY
ncbi:MAG: hypothetical protein PF630_06610 [Gammaproteobacteria bacterium]|nr:hypothetical protein [Gammaproteobacteria bacterium]